MKFGRGSVFNARVLAAYLMFTALVSIGGRRLGLDPVPLSILLGVACVAAIGAVLRHQDNS